MSVLTALVSVAMIAAPHRLKIAVMDVQGAPEQKATAAQLTPVVVGEFARQPDLQVISSREITAALGLAKQRQLLGCAEDSCMAEIGGALGVDFIVSSSLGRIGSRYRLDLRLVRAATGGITSSVGDFIAGSDDDLADATLRLADQLVAQLPGHQAAAPAPVGGLIETAPRRSHTGAYVAWGVAGALVAGAAVMTALTVSTFNDVHDTSHDPAQASTLKWKGPLADGLWAAAVVTGAVGTWLYFSAPREGAGGEVGLRGSF